ncbi:MAG: acyl-CoA dehydrogenase family protein [Elusimicrobiota bacterium]
MPNRKSSAADGFADALLSGRPVRVPRTAPASPSAELKRLLPPLARLLARVDGDAIDRLDRVPPAIISGLKRLGIFRLRVPRGHGGLGLSHSDYHRIVSLVAARSAGLAMWVTTQSLAVEILARAGTDAQRTDILPRLAAGDLSAFAMTEAGAGADPSRMAATARAVRGGYRLDGSKLWVTNGPVARWIVVLARAPGGIGAFLVDARAPGFSIERRCRFLGLRGMENGVLRLRGVFVPAVRRLGGEGDGLRLGLAAMNIGRLSVAPRALGLARECLRTSLEWARTRRSQGKPIAADASVAERLARMETLVARLSSVSTRTAAWADAGLDLRSESALAKLFAASAAWEAADLALQLRGGRGYETADSQRARGEKPEPVERLLRDARGLRVIEGTDDVLRGALARRRLALTGRGGRELSAGDYSRADEAVRLFGEICGRGGKA